MIPSNLSILDPALYSIASESLALDDLDHDRLISPENHNRTLSQDVQLQILSAYLCKLLCSNKYIDTVLPTGISSCHHTKPANQFSKTVNPGSQLDHHQPSYHFPCQAVIKGRTDPDHRLTGHSCVSTDKLNITSRYLSKFLHKDKSAAGSEAFADTDVQNYIMNVDVKTEQYSTICSGATPRPRWCPTQQQLQLLESLFESGTTTPSRDMISEITAHLKQFGSIIEANVFYWFQNRKARAKRNRQKLQQQQQIIKSGYSAAGARLSPPFNYIMQASSSSSSSASALASNSSWGSPQSSYNNNNSSMLDPLMGETICSRGSSSTNGRFKRNKPSSYNSSLRIDQLVELGCINDNTSGRNTKRNKPSNLTSYAGQSACDSSSNSLASAALMPSESSLSTSSNLVPVNRPDGLTFKLNNQVHPKSSPATVADMEIFTSFEQSNATASTVHEILNQYNYGSLDDLVPHHLQYYSPDISYKGLVQGNNNSDRAAIALTSQAHPVNDSTLSSHSEFETGHMLSNTVSNRSIDDQKLQIRLQQQQQTHRKQHVLNIGELLQFSSQPMNIPQLCPQYSMNRTLDRENIINPCGDQADHTRCATSLSNTNDVMQNELPPAPVKNNNTALIHHEHLGLPLPATSIEDAAFQLWVTNCQ